MKEFSLTNQTKESPWCTQPLCTIDRKTGLSMDDILLNQYQQKPNEEEKSELEEC